jgi:ATP-dependent DNA ligase
MNLAIVRPMLAESSPKPFSSDGFRYQVKLDGIRCLAYKQGDEVILRGRSDETNATLDITHRFPEIKLEALGDVILDGELVVMKDGKPDFSSIQQRNTNNKLAIRVLSKTLPAEYHVFDIPYQGRDLTSLDYTTRRALLNETVRETENVVIEPDFTNGERLFQKVVERGMEGIVAKRVDGWYTPGIRSQFWLKVRPLKTELFWACGFAPGSGRRNSSFGSIILGEARDNELVYIGNVGSGFSEKDIKDWTGKVVRQDFCPFYPTEPRIPVLYWFRPEPISVSYFERTEQGLRFPRLGRVS